MVLRGKVACIAGASGHLGAVLAALLAREGAMLVLIGQDQAKLDFLAKDLCVSEQRCLPLAVDARDASAVVRMAQQAMARFGHVDILLNTIGGWRGGWPMWETPVEVWEELWQLNVIPAVNLCRTFVGGMIAQKWGRIINVAAKAAVEPRKNAVVYGAVKASLVALTQGLAAEVKGTGVTANVILPSIIDSPANRQAMPSADPSKWVKPAEVAALMLYLCSDEAAAINGAAIPVYGHM